MYSDTLGELRDFKWKWRHEVCTTEMLVERCILLGNKSLAERN